MDRETELLTDYMCKTQKVYEEIRLREKQKLRLYAKLTKGTLNSSEKKEFIFSSNKLLSLIKEFESQNIPMLWKGLKYSSLIQYENLKFK